MKSHPIPKNIHDYLLYIGYKQEFLGVYHREHNGVNYWYKHRPSVNGLRFIAESENGRKTQLIDIKTIQKSLQPYNNNGYICRKEYLESLCEEYPEDIVKTLAGILGPNEDFDGLVSELEDYIALGGI
jgi:hypothetical protein